LLEVESELKPVPGTRPTHVLPLLSERCEHFCVHIAWAARHKAAEKRSSAAGNQRWFAGLYDCGQVIGAGCSSECYADLSRSSSLRSAAI